MGINLLSFLIVLTLFFIIIESVRRGILETKYSLLWIFTCVVMGFLIINENMLNKLSDFIGVYYAPSLLFLMGLLFSFLLIFDLTRRISKLNRELTTLTQEHAIMAKKLEEKE